MRDQATETHLVERLRQGDDSALGELSAAYGSKIFQLAFRYVKNREDAEEVTQDVLMKVYRKIDAFRATRRSRRGSTGSPSTRRCRGCGTRVPRG
jgi:DNA-directed RNA polymerase specialized sigma24 family protein